MRFGPIRRKGQLHAQSTLEARCVCKADPVFCMHMWASWLLAGRGDQNELVYPPGYYGKFLADLRNDLVAVGTPAAEASGIASHAFRHGAALDIHDSDGFAAACARGEWRSRAVTAYIPTTTIESRALAEALCMEPDEEVIPI